jgi:DNA-binding response OmpR family regulator
MWNSTEDIDRFPYDSAIERGASDFVVRPFSIRELALRIRHVVRQETVRVVSVTDELTGLYNRPARRQRGELKYLRSLSIGVAYYDPARPCTLEEFLAEGDRRMYENKKAKADAQAT